jgi:hypothetical protein
MKKEGINIPALKNFKIVDGFEITDFKFKYWANYKDVSFKSIKLPTTIPNV